jgi:hypothetical protein
MKPYTAGVANCPEMGVMKIELGCILYKIFQNSRDLSIKEPLPSSDMT